MKQPRVLRKFLVITLATVAFGTTATSATEDLSSFLRPSVVKTIGTFCHTGVVTMASQGSDFSIRAEDGRHLMLFARKRPFEVRPGDLVITSGNLVLLDNGDVHESVRSVQHLGNVSLPPPERVSLDELANHKFAYQRVTTEGTLILARHDEVDNRTVQLLIKDGATVMNATVNPISTNQTAYVISLLGARLRLTGVVVQPTGARRNIANFLTIDPHGRFEVIQPPPTDIFNAPEFDFGPIWAPSELAGMPLRRFDGVVLASWGSDQMMLEGKNFRRIKAALARPEEMPSAGDHVTVVGFPDTDQYGINLIHARCRANQATAADSPQPRPVDTALRHLLTDEQGHPRINGYSHGRLLRIKGTILDVQPSLMLFSLNDDGFTLPVDCSSSPSVMPRLEPNSKIEIIALAVVASDSWRESVVLPQTRGLRLVLRSEADLRVLTSPPWWTPARLGALIISLLVLFVSIIATIRILNRMMMRRKVVERTRLAVELHDSLSQTLAGVACQIAAGNDAVAEDPEFAKSLLGTAERMLESSRTELKNCLFDLRSDTVDDPDFERAIRRTLTGLELNAEIPVRFHVARTKMTDTTAHAVLCIIRELVANAIRHGSATRIQIAGAVDDGHLRFSVCDDGCGFDPNRHPGPRDGHFGLSGIRERIAAMNGSFTITSSPGSTRATVDITLP